LKVAFLSDIHGNLEALTVALKILDDRSVDRLVCLGDIVGYGANPSECLALIRKRTSTVILGNHDAAAIGKENIAYFNEYARAAALWTKSVLSKAEKKYLQTLPYEIQEGNLHFVHGTPLEPERWHYIFSPYDTVGQFEAVKGDVCFVGHSHVPGDYPERDVQDGTGKRIINVGSVGQPRDRDARLCFVLYDTETEEAEFVRAEYDIEVTVEKIRKAGLPIFLADRLRWGY